MNLPNGDRAHIGDKLRDYTLNPLHPRGKHKARKFKSVLGITIEVSQPLIQALLHAASTSQEAIAVEENEYGRVFELQFSLSTDCGRATISSVWMIRREEDFPRLVTCFIV